MLHDHCIMNMIMAFCKNFLLFKFAYSYIISQQPRAILRAAQLNCMLISIMFVFASYILNKGKKYYISVKVHNVY
jgi:glycerol-3-phosphate responsive antiterminator